VLEDLELVVILEVLAYILNELSIGGNQEGPIA